jgi:protein O-GlcNAc transferase
MWQKFAELGIENDRVDLVGLLPTTLEHLESYSNVDISVDTFPYAGTTTTCEALFMGVPVVTYQRKTVNSHAHNVGATLLSRMDVGKQLIATSEQEYIQKAIALAQDIPALQALRQQLRPAFLGSTICDGK